LRAAASRTALGYESVAGITLNETEFDKYAAAYLEMHAANIRITGEPPEYFAEYKVADVADLLRRDKGPVHPDILDFGAGIGTSVPYFRSYFPDSKLVALDVSRLSLEVGESRFGNAAEWVHFDGFTVPYPDESFDVVFLACVLHHVAHEEHGAVMQELYRVLRPGGQLAVFEHNPFNPLTRHAVDTCPFDENAVLVRPARLRSAAEGAGFVGASIAYRIFFPHALRRLRSLEPYLTRVPLGGQYRLHAHKPLAR
jgi:SAM-dependent methyltransferase